LKTRAGTLSHSGYKPVATNSALLSVGLSSMREKLLIAVPNDGATFKAEYFDPIAAA
jgi:hypothetical protein